MATKEWTPEELALLARLVDEGVEWTEIAKQLGRSVDSVYNKAKRLERAIMPRDAAVTECEERLDRSETDESLEIDYYGTRITTVDELIEHAQVDMTIWEVDRVAVNQWEVAGKLKQGQELDPETQHMQWKAERLWKTPLRQIKITFRRKSDERMAIEALLEKMASRSGYRPKAKRPALEKRGGDRALEISIMDPHYGMVCFPPSADRAQTLESCEQLCRECVEIILDRSTPYGPFAQIVLPIGNDFLHADNLYHTTTAGTQQPEAIEYHHVYERGEELLISLVERLRQVAPVHVIEVPGNHDRLSAFTMGRVLRAYYRNDEDVEVDVSGDPYKFWQWGMCLVGFEHGHSVKGVRLAGLMANCCPRAWFETAGGYREFHCGDQHRKGSSVPAYFEEQGVSVEYLPGLASPNAWHRIKSFNHQKCGACGFVWDKRCGPIARNLVHINSETGRPLGAGGRDG